MVLGAQGDEDAVNSLETLMDMYEKSVGRNATLVIGLTPGPDGLLPEGDVRRLEEWGAEIQRRYGMPLAATSGSGDTLLLELPPSHNGSVKSVDRCVIREDIALGERIRSFRVEAMGQDGCWETVYSGISVGNRHIAVSPIRWTPPPSVSWWTAAAPFPGSPVSACMSGKHY